MAGSRVLEAHARDALIDRALRASLDDRNRKDPGCGIWDNCHCPACRLLVEDRVATRTRVRRIRTRACALGAAVTRRRQANARRESGSRRRPNGRAKTQRSCGANQGCTGSGTANCDAHRLPDRLDGGNEKGADVLSFRRKNCSKVDYCKCPRRMPLLWRWADSMDVITRKSMLIVSIAEKNFGASGTVSFYAMKPCPLLSFRRKRKPDRKPWHRVARRLPRASPNAAHADRFGIFIRFLLAPPCTARIQSAAIRHRRRVPRGHVPQL